MAEILTQTMHRFSADVATSNGNIVIGTADATDSNTQGVSKSAESIDGDILIGKLILYLYFNQ